MRSEWIRKRRSDRPIATLPATIQKVFAANVGLSLIPSPNVICFTGYSARDVTHLKGEQISKEEGAMNCVEGLKKVVGHAEQKNVTLCMEMLNSREDSHPMKGHPGYQGDHTDYCIDIIKQTQAVQKAIDKLNGLLLERHLGSCVTTAIRGNQPDERERVIKELLDVFETSTKL